MESQSSTPDSSSARDLLIITALTGILFFVALGARDLWSPNEPIYGRAVVEMAERGDWLIPSVNGKVFAEKPILYYWSALTSSKLLGGIDEFSLRVPSALAGVASALLTFLLVLPYVGRRRALLTVALFATLYQVFWAARAVQMDVLVLASTLGALVPLTRMLDFGWSPTRAWLLTGLASGLGFTAKGPVTLVIPGLIILAYAISTRQLRGLVTRHLVLGGLAAIAISAPWYLALWVQGESDFLYEVLIRQNFIRFVQAWDHDQPWWYFLKYLWLDYFPWAWLLPAALLLRTENGPERRLHKLSWIWILATIGFFSLSESKRAPYILPIAPAVAILAGSVLDRWHSGRLALSRGAYRAAVAAAAALVLVLCLAGTALLGPWLELPASLTATTQPLGLLWLSIGLFAGGALAWRRHLPALAPKALLGGMAALYLSAAIWGLPAFNGQKSARAFTEAMNRHLEAEGGDIASFGFWDWRAGYSFYSRRSIPNLESADLSAYWQSSAHPHVLVEDSDKQQLLDLIPEARVVEQSKIGSRAIFLFARDTASGHRSQGIPSLGAGQP